nr:integrase, catalytic region, zinc finger, CCHC-type, peptidase aspartic, catalytic [Tanacetum cinerariifolium]
MSITSSKCSLWNVIFMHSQLMVSRPKIYLWEKLRPLQKVHCSGELIGSYTVLAFTSKGLVIVAVRSVAVYKFLKTLSHSSLGDKPLPTSFLGSGLVFYLHSGLPTFLSSGLELTAVYSFDTQPPMLDRTDFASWQQRIRLYCRGKENGVNILKSINDGPFQIGMIRETVDEGKEGLPKDIYTLINHYTDVKYIWDNVKMLLEGSELTKEDRESQLYDDFEHFHQSKGETIHDYYVKFTKLINDMRNIKITMPRMQLNSKIINNILPEWGRFVTVVKLNRGLKESNYDQLYAYLKQHEVHANENRMMLERFTQHMVDPLALLSNVSPHQRMDVMRLILMLMRPTTQTMFMANLSFADPVYDKADLSYDSDILSEVHDHDNYQDAICELHEVHEIHDNVQPNCVVDSDVEYTSDSNMILYDKYVKDNVEPVVQNNVSFVPNDTSMMIINEMHEQTAQFITDHNIKEKNLKKELHSVKIQLNSTINHNKLMVEEVTSLKKDFKQKENKYLEEFLDMKALKEKVEDKLFKQDQSLQTVHMLCKPKSYYDKQRKVAIGYKNPLCLTRAKQVQPSLYNGHEIIKTHHVLAIVHNSEDTLEIVK